MELEGGHGNSVIKRRNPIEFGLVCGVNGILLDVVLKCQRWNNRRHYMSYKKTSNVAQFTHCCRHYHYIYTLCPVLIDPLLMQNLVVYFIWDCTAWTSGRLRAGRGRLTTVVTSAVTASSTEIYAYYAGLLL
ncbi:hypothetical protein EVAR_55330_1 [Eumeta japonica]|uniref:Uncharacterized protein n=1 Tax=Eumeta variegata TaxID=151549 RepID=A0A4C1Z7R8_EUMVA|nr:hypothetical protein EVAR_55330_1 [Eumeta japonica]